MSLAFSHGILAVAAAATTEFSYLQNRHQESEGLSGPGLRSSHQVLAGEQRGDRLGLQRYGAAATTEKADESQVQCRSRFEERKREGESVKRAGRGGGKEVQSKREMVSDVNVCRRGARQVDNENRLGSIGTQTTAVAAQGAPESKGTRTSSTKYSKPNRIKRKRARVCWRCSERLAWIFVVVEKFNSASAVSMPADRGSAENLTAEKKPVLTSCCSPSPSPSPSSSSSSSVLAAPPTPLPFLLGTAADAAAAASSPSLWRLRAFLPPAPAAGACGGHAGIEYHAWRGVRTVRVG